MFAMVAIYQLGTHVYTVDFQRRCNRSISLAFPERFELSTPK